MVALFYSTPFNGASLPVSLLTSAGSSGQLRQLLGSLSVPGEPGLSELTEALREDPAYRPVASGPYNGANHHGIYVIWRMQAAK